MEIIFNGESREVKSRGLGEIIKELDGVYKQGCMVAVISEKKGEALKNEFSLETAKGVARIKLARESKERETEAVSGSLFHELYRKFHTDVAGRVRWVSEDITAIGPIGTNLRVDRRKQRYKKWDVFFGFGGFDPGMTYLMISKREHEAAYGTGIEALIGRLTRGRSIVAGLDEGDKMVAIHPLITKEERVGFLTSDLNTEIKEGQEILTLAKIKLSQEAPMSSEHFLSLAREEIIHVDARTHTHIASEALKGISLPVENVQYRSKYQLSVRNKGTEKGKVYAYKESRLPNPSHNVFGEVIQGRDLIEYAQVGDTIYTVTEPRWMMVVGRTQKEAEEFFEREDIEQVREGNKDDSAVVVDQIPALTMDIKEKGTVRTVGVEEEAVFDVVLYHEEAPRTVWYFKKITGLVNRPIGYLKVFFSVSGMMVLFQGRADEAGALIPENSPREVVKKEMLGVTNMSRANQGMMGIRLDESKEYGPTGEAFDGTNIALSILHLTPSKISLLSKLKEGDVIYVRPMRKR